MGIATFYILVGCIYLIHGIVKVILTEEWCIADLLLGFMYAIFGAISSGGSH